MFIVPMSSGISPLDAVGSVFDRNETAENEKSEVSSPSFLDVFYSIYDNAVETNAQKQQDIVQLMLGETDNLEEIQANITKAEVAVELLTTVKNTVVDSYNEIIRMSI